MTKTVGRNTNVNDTAILSDAIALNASTSVTLSAGGTVLPRVFFAVSNNTNKEVWIKLQAASVDDDKKGIFLPRNSYWEMIADSLYTGEISAIANSGTPDVYVTEY